ncbi:phosphatidylserine decarboxylase-domain-containing protein [Mrakia frigida]|uniref:phosphatidylserine decarboxylase 1 n=1 Tax=Mrakia frigida TaxID=29902 RepID=UPI003FCC0472
MPPLRPPPPLDSSFASSSSSSLSPSLQPSTSPTVGPSSMPPISQPGLRARAAYRAYLPPRPNLNWRRSFRTTATNKDQTTEGGGEQKKKRRGMGSRLKGVWASKRPSTRWVPIPLGLGALVVGVLEYQRNWNGSRRRDRADVGMAEDGDEMIVRVRGPWQVHVMGALPLRSLSRLWGYLNSFELPVWSREPGFKLYSWAFGCNLDELAQPDLKQYVSLGDFFYRKLKDGVRPIADVALVSPADGKLLHFGAISGAKVEQVKGMSYSLDALLGKTGGPESPSAEDIEFDTDSEREFDDHDFANINDIDYSLGDLLGSNARKVSHKAPADGVNEESDTESLLSNSSNSSGSSTPTVFSSSSASQPGSPAEDASVPTEMFGPDSVAHDASVATNMGIKAALEGQAGSKSSVTKLREGNGLFFTVIYLAPGDYHRFHSPTAWVVERRRHFAGELFSVSPYIARRLSNLFVLNERVALLGRWKHGFFGMVPVGATNVGSIKINFDEALRTNNRLRPHPAGTYIEAVYSKASKLLRGQPLNPGDEMGGFMLGSTIVLIFEAPLDFAFSVQEGQKIKVGEPIGFVPSATPSPTRPASPTSTSS